ncbi:hypothetical protein J6R97_08720 [bacterium]|nr:hypothetical protein [bacterium]
MLTLYLREKWMQSMYLIHIASVLFKLSAVGWVQPNKNYQAHSFFFLNLMSKYKDPETSSECR